MLAEEAQSVAVQVTFKGLEVTASVIRSLLQAIANRNDKPHRGEQSLKNLNKQHQPLENVEIADKALKDLKKELRAFGVDFSVMKNKENNQFEIFFKSGDHAQINSAFRNYAATMFPGKGNHSPGQSSENEKPDIDQTINNAKSVADELNSLANNKSEPHKEQPSL